METVHAAEQVSFQSSLIRVEVKAGLRFEAPKLKKKKRRRLIELVRNIVNFCFP